MYRVIVKGLTQKTAGYSEVVSRHRSFDGAERKARAVNRSLERREHPLSTAWNVSPDHHAFVERDSCSS